VEQERNLVRSRLNDLQLDLDQQRHLNSTLPTLEQSLKQATAGEAEASKRVKELETLLKGKDVFLEVFQTSSIEMTNLIETQSEELKTLRKVKHEKDELEKSEAKLQAKLQTTKLALSNMKKRVLDLEVENQRMKLDIIELSDQLDASRAKCKSTDSTRQDLVDSAGDEKALGHPIKTAAINAIMDEDIFELLKKQTLL